MNSFSRPFGHMMVVFSGVFLLALGANASSLNCASADARLVYSYAQPDGGPRMNPTETLSVDGQTYISVPRLGGATLRLADFKFVGAKKKIATRANKSAMTTTVTFAQRITVVSSADASKLFDGLVMCEDTTYQGPPRP